MARSFSPVITQAISDSHFQPPIEVTDPIRAPVNFTSPWMVCIRSAQSEETRRITYTAFFKDGYTSSRYSAINDRMLGLLHKGATKMRSGRHANSPASAYLY